MRRSLFFTLYCGRVPWRTVSNDRVNRTKESTAWVFFSFSFLFFLLLLLVLVDSIPHKMVFHDYVFHFRGIFHLRNSVAHRTSGYARYPETTTWQRVAVRTDNRIRKLLRPESTWYHTVKPKSRTLYNRTRESFPVPTMMISYRCNIYFWRKSM